MSNFMKNVHIVAILASLLLNSVFAESSLPDLPKDSGNRISTQEKIIIKKFVFEGNTVFSDDQLAELIGEYENVPITVDKIHDLRDTLTKLYIEEGYINSGIVVKDQTLTDGTLVLTVIEGVIAKMNLQGNRWLRDHYILSRIERELREPVNIFDLQRPLQLLQQDPMIRSINTKLTAGVEPGEGILNIDVVETTPYQLGFLFNNYRSPSTGSYHGKIYSSYRSLLGWGETFGGSYGTTEGADDFDVFFDARWNPSESQITASYAESDSTIITDVFRDLNIDSESEIFTLTLRQPYYQSVNREFSMFLTLERKKSETFLLSQRTSLSAGVDEGVSRITILNIGQEFVNRNQESVLALRSNFGIGLDWLHATIVGDPPDGEFFLWEGQAQVVSRLPFWKGQVLLRAGVRLSDDQLPPLEKYGIGGRNTVRGYRENELTNDNGFVGSLEFRFPIGKIKIPKISTNLEDGEIKVIPFFDYGNSWAKNNDDIDSTNIYSVGLGLRWEPGKNIMAEIFWGQKLNNVSRNDDYDLQDDGIHLQISASIF